MVDTTASKENNPELEFFTVSLIASQSIEDIEHIYGREINNPCTKHRGRGADYIPAWRIEER